MWSKISSLLPVGLYYGKFLQKYYGVFLEKNGTISEINIRMECRM